MSNALKEMNEGGSFRLILIVPALCGATAVSQTIYFFCMIIHYNKAKCPQCKHIYCLYDVKMLDRDEEEYLEHKAKTRREQVGRASVNGSSVNVYGDVTRVSTREMKRVTVTYLCRCGVCKHEFERTQVTDSYGDWNKG